MLRIVIVGSGGRLGRALSRAYQHIAEVIGFDHSQLDLVNFDQVEKRLRPLEFDLLINCAALTNVDYCETHREEAFLINAEAPALLARLSREKSARMIHFSTDYVFDGSQTTPYTEEDEAKPISIYGESKLAGERNVLEESDGSLVVRVSWVFGPDRASFVDQVIKNAQERAEAAAVADKFSTPTYTLDLADWLKTAWQADLNGVLHLANAGACSWQEYAQHALACCTAAGMNLKTTHVTELSLTDMKNFVARRPPFTVLSTKKFTRLTGSKPRHWREAVADYVKNYVAKNELTSH
jgi:dTDP-4-dehydrorhamnose reductase